MLPVMAAPQWGPGRYAADREPRLAKLRSAAALLPLGTGQTSNCGDGTARMKTCGENLTDARGDSSSPDQASLRSGKLSGLNRNRCPTSIGTLSGLNRNPCPTSSEYAAEVCSPFSSLRKTRVGWVNGRTSMSIQNVFDPIEVPVELKKKSCCRTERSCDFEPSCKSLADDRPLPRGFG